MDSMMSGSSPSRGEGACTVVGGGFLGVFIGFFCPLCVPGSAAVLSAIGLSFIVQQQIIFPLIGLFAIVLLYGLAHGYRRHGNVLPLLLGVLGVFSLPLGRYILGSAVLTYLGAFSVIVASLANLFMSSAGVRNLLRSPASASVVMLVLVAGGTVLASQIFRVQNPLEDKMLADDAMMMKGEGTIDDGAMMDGGTMLEGDTNGILYDGAMMAQ